MEELILLNFLNLKKTMVDLTGAEVVITLLPLLVSFKLYLDCLRIHDLSFMMYLPLPEEIE